MSKHNQSVEDNIARVLKSNYDRKEENDTNKLSGENIKGVLILLKVTDPQTPRNLVTLVRSM